MKEITFKNDSFNLSAKKNNFINPCCYGEDVANWFKPQMEALDIDVIEIYQEDWGLGNELLFQGQ
ncbi:hypothetical protein [uncultured Microbulbifer sp.]|uniref:hypothetical protein n=1 Tax=uncultured Microbulbifer sp. TaxID=348147 RepID=UPI002605456B|nr:hypothetical protein [uncultured Microbulbifer sp.]